MQTIHELSKDSAHFINEQRKQSQMDAKVAALKEKASLVPASEVARLQRSMDLRAAVLESSRDLSRTWIHVDMDAFFASCEELVNPALVSIYFPASSFRSFVPLRGHPRSCLLKTPS